MEKHTQHHLQRLSGIGSAFRQWNTRVIDRGANKNMVSLVDVQTFWWRRACKRDRDIIS